jgi:hypothetical protein
VRDDVTRLLLIIALAGFAIWAIRASGKSLREALRAKLPEDDLGALSKEEIAAVIDTGLATAMDLAKMRPSERQMLVAAAVKMRQRGGAAPIDTAP